MIKYCYPLKVYYKDIDQMGIVYYSRYFEYFEEARTEMLAAIGLKYSEVEAQGFILRVIEAHAEYKKGASFEDELIIETSNLPKGIYFINVHNTNTNYIKKLIKLYKSVNAIKDGKIDAFFPVKALA